MWVLAPIIFLAVAVLAQIAVSRLRAEFRSYWLLAISGSVLAVLALLFLRLRLPSTLAFSGWSVGALVEHPFPISINGFSWTLALTLVVLLLGRLLAEAGRAMTAKWRTWVPSSILCASALLAILSGDLLALAAAFFLFDCLRFAIQISALDGKNQNLIFLQLGLNTTGTALVLVAFSLAIPAPGLQSQLIPVAAAIRLLAACIRTSAHSKQTWDLVAMDDFAAPAVAATLFGVAQSLPASAVLVVVPISGLLSLYVAIRHLGTNRETFSFWTAGFGLLALAAAATGDRTASLGFAMAMLFGEPLLAVLSWLGRARSAVTIVAAVTLSGILFTPLSRVSGWLSASPGVWFIPVYALLLTGWLRDAFNLKSETLKIEPGTRGLLFAGLGLPAVVFVLFGFGLAPSIETQAASSVWMGFVVLLVATLFFLATRSRRRVLPPHFVQRCQRLASGRWLIAGITGLAGSFEAGANLVGRILEGEAGVLWALLLVALLLSLVVQLGLAG